MKIEFRDPSDLQQACYEATVDLTVYITHLKDIARRCEKNFPEVAEGLRGTAAGIGRYLRGVDGKWFTDANLQQALVLRKEDFHNHLWAYEFSRDPRAASILLGCMAAISTAKPDLTFYEALDESRLKLSNLEPLIEQLLASSPARQP
jgi:hypothetical protein